MVTILLAQGRMAALPMRAAISRLQTWMDSLLVGAEGAPDGGQIGGNFPTWVIAVGIVVILLCLLPVCIFGLLVLLGPAIGNVFSTQQPYF